MTSGVNIAEFSQTQDRLRDGRKTSAQNLDLADQLTFSSVLRAQVDTAQQGLEQVQDAATQRMQADRAADQSQSAAPTEPRPKRATNDDTHQTSARKDTSRSTKPKFALDDKPKTETKAPAAPKQDDDQSAPAADATTPKAAQVADQNAAPIQPDVTAPVAAAIATPAAKPDEQTKPADDAAASLTQVIAQLHGAKPTEDAGQPVHAQIRAMHEHTVGQLADEAVKGSDTHSLKAAQEADLANRIDSSAPVVISVDTGNSAAAQPMPTSAPLLSADTQRAAFSLTSNNTPAPNDQSFDQQPTPDRQMASTHGDLTLPQTPAAPSMQPQPDLLSSVLSAQASSMAAQQTAAETEAQAGPVEIAPVGGAAVVQAPQQTAPTTKAAPATPTKQPEKPQAPAEQIAVKIRQAVGEGLDKINIKLHPADLGRIEVKLDVAKDGTVSATVLAEKPETLDLLQKDQRGLQQALTDSGLKVDTANLNFGLQAQGQQLADAGRDRRMPYSRNDARTVAKVGATGEMPAMPVGAVYGRNLRSNGGVDIRI